MKKADVVGILEALCAESIKSSNNCLCFNNRKLKEYYLGMARAYTDAVDLLTDKNYAEQMYAVIPFDMGGEN